MRSLFRLFTAGAGVLLATVYLVAVSGEAALNFFRQYMLEPETAAAATATTVVDRARKGDRLGVARRGNDQDMVIATVEIIGLRDAAVVYRARDGRVLFRTDPIENATVVAKGVVLPEVTIRHTRRPALETVPAAVKTVPLPPPGDAGSTASEPKILEGCDPAFSPLTARANFSGRCLAASASPTRVATALP